jgi:hypothetical protein
MSDPRADQIVKIKQSIATLEEQQRSLNADLSTALQPLRELLAQLEQPADAPTIGHVSGGLDAQAESIDIGGDAVGRDKIESRTESTQVTATMSGSGAIAPGSGAVAAGERGVAIGGSVTDTSIITGDHNTPDKTKKN